MKVKNKLKIQQKLFDQNMIISAIYKCLCSLNRGLFDTIKSSHIVFDFLEVNLIWCAHQMHHSSEDYNMTTALRQSFIQAQFSSVSICL